MKKIVAAVAAVIVLAGVAIVVLGSKGKTDGTDASTASASYKTVKACDVFTDSVAAQVLGASYVKGTVTDPTSSDDIVFDNCIYTAGPEANPPHSTSVAVRSAKTSNGADSNKAMFTATGRPAGAEAVSGYGDAAYWDPGLGQLDILKGNNWYIVSNYTGTSPANGTATLAMAEELAQKLKLQ